jgi:hypothetical protein
MPEFLWYRGHADLGHGLIPSALRYSTTGERNSAFNLLSEFRRVAEMKLARPPRWDDTFRWVQLAQHYGIPTRLLDWTESPTVALYFACQRTDCDGVVLVMNPVDLNRASFKMKPRILDQDQDSATISRYLSLTEGSPAKKLKTLAVNPVWSSERIMAQKGVFTLHGTEFYLDDKQAPSLVAIPIFREAKSRLQRDLQRIGIDEMGIFPELEHACSFLRKRAAL